MFGFSSKILVTNIFTQINNNIFSVLLGKFFSEVEVGYYTQANKWNTMGHSLITGMVSGVAQPVLTEVANDAGRQRNVFRKMLRFTALIVAFVTVNIVWMLVWHYFVWQQIRLSLWNALKDVIPFAALAGITMVVTYYATRSIGNIYLLFTAKVVVAAILYTLLMWGSNSVVFKESIQFLKKKK